MWRVEYVIGGKDVVKDCAGWQQALEEAAALVKDKNMNPAEIFIGDLSTGYRESLRDLYAEDKDFSAVSDMLDHLSQGFHEYEQLVRSKVEEKSWWWWVLDFAAPLLRISYICWIDIDGFKRINDKYGFSTGRLVVKEILSLLQRNIPWTYILFWIWGDEFILLAPQTETEDAQMLGDRLRDLVEKHHFACQAGLNVTISIGIAPLPRHTQGAGEYMQTFVRALRAGFKAKEKGGNAVCIIDDIDDRT